jgi:hypothetical protein
MIDIVAEINATRREVEARGAEHTGDAQPAD